MEGRNYVEWTCENFSCWDPEFHGIYFPKGMGVLNLYPRGLTGDGEHLVVQVYDYKQSSRVEMFIISGDGSLLCKQEVQDPKWEGSWLTLPPGPTFEEVVRASKNNKDVLTLRIYRSDNNFNWRGCTTIDVRERFIKIPASVLKSMEIKNLSSILDLYFNEGGQTRKMDLRFRLTGSTCEDTEISIDIVPNFKTENVLLRACVLLFDCHDVVIQSKEGKHIFRDEIPWVLPITFRLKEVKENQHYLTLSIKLIFKEGLKSSCCIYNELAEFASNKPKSLENGENLTTEKVSCNSPTATALSQELMCLYQDQDFSDCILKCDKVSIPVHKNILSARSPVFKTMFSCDMREAASSEVVITDLDPSTLASFITFLYTGNVENLQWDIALQLYYAADKYQVPTLKKECADFLVANVSVSNVCDLLLLADNHQDEQMTSVAYNIISKNYNKVLSSTEWKTFMKTNPSLLLTTVTTIAEKNYSRESFL